MRVATIFISLAVLAMAIWIAHAGRPSGNLYIESKPARIAATGDAAGHSHTRKWQLRAENSPTKVIRLSLEQVT
jgi:hypothetical protein